VEKGVWATQRHNEGILDQAFRTSTHVYLIFGVNKSGEFYGCARYDLRSSPDLKFISRRMAGPISRNEAKVPWASRTDSSPSSRSSLSPLASRDSSSSQPSNLVLSPSEKRFMDNSPLPVTPEPESKASTSRSRQREGTNSAPAELHQLHQKFTYSTPDPQNSIDQLLKTEKPTKPSREFHLDRNAPAKAVRQPPPSSSAIINDRNLETIPEPPLEDVPEEVSRPGKEEDEEHEPKKPDDASWGEPFKIQWIHTDRLPFQRTRHLRNPWNHDREIKVSRDGTELEPSVGQALLEEWDRTDISPSLPTSHSVGWKNPKNPGTQSQQSNRSKRDKDWEGD
jgi:hypothetical protein